MGPELPQPEDPDEIGAIEVKEVCWMECDDGRYKPG